MESEDYGAALIGITNLGSVGASMLHAFLVSKRKSLVKSHYELASFRIPLIISAILACSGNVLFALSMNKVSLVMALTGRFLIGFGSTEVLNRKLITLVVTQCPKVAHRARKGCTSRALRVHIACTKGAHRVH